MASIPGLPLTIADFSTEVLIHLFKFVDLQSLGKSAQVCKLWNNIINNNSDIWRAQIEHQKRKVYYPCNHFFSPLNPEDPHPPNFEKTPVLIADGTDTEGVHFKITMMKTHIYKFQEDLKKRKETFFQNLLYQRPDLLADPDGNPIEPNALRNEFWKDATRILLQLALQCDHQLIKDALLFNLEFNSEPIFDALLTLSFSGTFPSPDLQILGQEYLQFQCAIIVGLLARKKQKLKLPMSSQRLESHGLNPNLSQQDFLRKIGGYYENGLFLIRGLKLSDYVESGLFNWNGACHFHIVMDCCIVYVNNISNLSTFKYSEIFYTDKEQQTALIRLFEEGIEHLSHENRRTFQIIFASVSNPKLALFKAIIEKKLT